MDFQTVSAKFKPWFLSFSAKFGNRPVMVEEHSSGIHPTPGLRPTEKNCSRKPSTRALEKDQKYFEKRKKNNLAAKKSRDAKKFRDDQVSNGFISTYTYLGWDKISVSICNALVTSK